MRRDTVTLFSAFLIQIIFPLSLASIDLSKGYLPIIAVHNEATFAKTFWLKSTTLLASAQKPTSESFLHKYVNAHIEQGSSGTQTLPDCAELSKAEPTKIENIEEWMAYAQLLRMQNCPSTYSDHAKKAFEKTFSDDSQHTDHLMNDSSTSGSRSPWKMIAERFQLLDMMTESRWEKRSTIIQALRQYLTIHTSSEQHKSKNIHLYVDVVYTLAYLKESPSVESMIHSDWIANIHKKNLSAVQLAQAISKIVTLVITDHVNESFNFENTIEYLIQMFHDISPQPQDWKVSYQIILVLLQMSGNHQACLHCLSPLKRIEGIAPPVLVNSFILPHGNDPVKSHIHICPLIPLVSKPQIHCIERMLLVSNDSSTKQIEMTLQLKEKDSCYEGFPIPYTTHAVLLYTKHSVGLFIPVEQHLYTDPSTLLRNRRVTFNQNQLETGDIAYVKGSSDILDISFELQTSRPEIPSSKQSESMIILSPKKPRSSPFVALLAMPDTDIRMPSASSSLFAIERIRSKYTQSLPVDTIISSLQLTYPCIIFIYMVTSLAPNTYIPLAQLNLTLPVLQELRSSLPEIVSIRQQNGSTYKILGKSKFWHPQPLMMDTRDEEKPDRLNVVIALILLILFTAPLYITKKYMSAVQINSDKIITFRTCLLSTFVCLTGVLLLIYWMQWKLTYLLKLFMFYLPILYIIQQLASIELHSLYSSK